jgi:hypothetical protein
VELNTFSDTVELPSPSLKAAQAKEGYRIRLISGTANHELADNIAEWLGVTLEKSDIKRWLNELFYFVFIFLQICRWGDQHPHP